MSLASSIYQWAGRTFGLTEVEPWKIYAKNAGYGRAVTVEGAMGLTVIFACVRLVADSVAGLPVDVYERTDSGLVSRPDHDVARVLAVQPNAWMTPFQFKRAMMLDLLTRGNGFAEIQLGVRGNLIGLLPLRAAGMRMMFEGGWPHHYEHTDEQGRVTRYELEQIFHLRGFGNGFWGFSPISENRMAVASAMASQEYGLKSFSRGMRRAGYLTIDQILKPEQRTQIGKAIVEPMESGDSSIAVLEAGMKFEGVSLTPEDAQYIENQKWQVVDLARMFGVPPPMIGELDRATWANMEELGTQFVQYGIIPHTNEWQGSASRLFAPGDRRRLFIKFNVNALMRGNSAARSNFYAVMIRNGVMSVNEVRGLEDLEPKEGGDELRAQMQMQPLGSEPAAPQSGPPVERRANLRVVQ